MRVVGPGHYFHPQTGLCRRCGLATVDDNSRQPCLGAPRSPHPRPSTKIPNLYAASKKQ